MKRILIALASIPVALWAFWLVFPETSIQSIIEDSLTREFKPEVEGLKKGLFYDLSADNLLLENSGREIISINNISAHVSPLALMLFRLELTMNGVVSRGTISGDMNLSKNSMRISLEVKEADISDISLFKLAGIHGKGTVSGRFTMTDETGHLEFAASDANFEPLVFSDTTVPLNFFNGVKGAIDIKGDILNIVSISLEGRDIYARMKGVVRDSVLDLNMELMPGKSYTENPFLLAGIGKYKISPGYYVIPVRGNLSI